MYIHAYIHIYIYIHTFAHMYVCMYVCMYVYTHTYMIHILAAGAAMPLLVFPAENGTSLITSRRTLNPPPPLTREPGHGM